LDGYLCDISDVNNDGLLDIMVVDMLPEDNYRRKMIIPGSSYDRFQLTLDMGYEPQYTRNTLQLNNGDGTFSEVGQMAGIDQTDWSWSSLFADFDNDGDKDLMVTNGFLRDVGNLDYISYQRKSNTPFGSKKEQYANRLKEIQKLGEVKAAYADLDQDGDLDLVINNVNDKAVIYENQSNEINTNNYLKIQFKGNKENHSGIGAKVSIYANGQQQFAQHSLYRGYESTVSREMHFGIGDAQTIDSVKVEWPDRKVEWLNLIPANTTLILDYANAIKQASSNHSDTKFFAEIATEKGLVYKHEEQDFIDFKVQPLLPHKHSQNGPGIAVGDINGDGLADCYIGGSAGYYGQFFIQKEDGKFVEHPQKLDAIYEDMGSLFFDADNDGDVDLYIVSGGSSSPPKFKKYQDRLYINDGKGDFKISQHALPVLNQSGASVIGTDYDHDGDIDLFVGGRIAPGNYPMPPKSFLLRNDSENGQVKFTDITPESLAEIGMVTSALWTDYDNDGWQDLLLVGEFMPITFFRNEGGKIQNSKFTIQNSSGWWNSLTAGDFDKDGDIDYLAGNLGLNSRYKTSPEEPLCVYANDYDKNGRIDPVLCQYHQGENFVTHPRSQLIAQINAMRVRFKTYEEYASRPFEKSFLKKEIKSAHVLKTETFSSVLLENKGNGDFQMKALPTAAQVAPIFGMITNDYDKDGFLDVLIVGNSYATETSIGNYDALKGLILKGKKNGGFETISAAKSGFLVDSDAKGLAQLVDKKGQTNYLVSNNQDRLKVFQNKRDKKQEIIPLETLDVYAFLKFKDGSIIKQEFYYGNTYLSQSSRTLTLSAGITQATIFNSNGESRVVKGGQRSQN